MDLQTKTARGFLNPRCSGGSHWISQGTLDPPGHNQLQEDAHMLNMPSSSPSAAYTSIGASGAFGAHLGAHVSDYAVHTSYAHARGDAFIPSCTASTCISATGGLDGTHHAVHTSDTAQNGKQPRLFLGAWTSIR